MNALEEKIMNYISDHPGSRERDIANALHMNLTSLILFNAFNNLVKNGVLHSEIYRDVDNMEFYDMWFVVAP